MTLLIIINYMKKVINAILNFVKKEWFLLVMMVTIILVLVIFELL